MDVFFRVFSTIEFDDKMKQTKNRFKTKYSNDLIVLSLNCVYVNLNLSMLSIAQSDEIL